MIKSINSPVSCADCKYSVKVNKHYTCKLFEFILNEDNFLDFHVNADICRSNDVFCGPNGDYFIQKISSPNLK